MATYNEIISDIGKGAKEIATKIAGNSYAETIFPSGKAFAGELNEAINNNAKLNAKLHASKINEKIPKDIEDVATSLKQLGADIDIDKDKAYEIARVMHGTDYSEKSFEKLSQSLQDEGIEKDMANNIVNNIREKAEDILSSEINFDDVSIFQKAPTYVKTYFNNPDKKIRNTRIATAAATYTGVAVGGRYLSGGTLTTDNYGRKDIAGVPFL